MRQRCCWETPRHVVDDAYPSWTMLGLVEGRRAEPVVGEPVRVCGERSPAAPLRTLSPLRSAPASVATMKLTGSLEKAFNDQVSLELTAALVYRQLGIDMEAIDLPGIASWFRAQADEEMVHAYKFIDHMIDRDAHPRIEALKVEIAPATTALEAFEASLAHEQHVSEAIRELYRKAEAEGDLDSRPILNWFVDEQLEEEATVSEIISRVKRIGKDGAGLLKLEEQLASRPGGEDPASADE